MRAGRLHLPVKRGEARSIVTAHPLNPRRQAERFEAEAMMDINDVAALLNTTVRHIRRLVAERRIPFHKIGGKVRFWRHDVEAWVDATLVPAKPSGDWRRGSARWHAS